MSPRPDLSKMDQKEVKQAWKLSDNVKGAIIC